MVGTFGLRASMRWASASSEHEKTATQRRRSQLHTRRLPDTGSGSAMIVAECRAIPISSVRSLFVLCCLMRSHWIWFQASEAYQKSRPYQYHHNDMRSARKREDPVDPPSHAVLKRLMIASPEVMQCYRANRLRYSAASTKPSTMRRESAGFASNTPIQFR